MIRVVIENIVLFLLPTLAYVGYVYLTRRDTDGGGKILDDAPFIWLAVAGAALVILTLLAFGSTTGSGPGHGYVPPSLNERGIEPGKLN